jgi:taurine dioxygenase
MTSVRTETPDLTVERLAGRIGAEIGGVNTGEQLDDETIAEIRRALLAHRVVFFHDQSLDYDRQVAFAQRLGQLTLGHPTLPSPKSQPFLEEVDSAKAAPANRWHTDVTFCDRPPAFTLLHGVVMPEVGGDTIWANTVGDYQSLPKELRELADTLRIVHANTHDYAKPSSREEGRTTSSAPIAASSCPRFFAPSIRPCAYTRRLVSARSCSADSPRRWSASARKRRET